MTSTRISAFVLAVGCALPVVVGQAGPWRQVRDLAAAGWDTGALEQARELAESAGSAAILAVHDGRVIVAWGDVERRFKCHSVRKSIMSALFGIAIERGLIDPEETIDSLQIDDLDPLSETEKSARVFDLLAARSGVYHPAAKEPDDMKTTRPARHSRQPGESFHYNNWDFNVLGVIFNERAGLDVFAAFDQWLARPLGMEDFERGDGSYELEPTNSRHPAYAFRLSARDLARFGLLYAQSGTWGGRAIVSEKWFDASTESVSEFASGRGYGYMWWIYPPGTLRQQPTLNRHKVIAGIGTGGQLLMVVPSAGFVFVHRGDTDNDRRVAGQAIWTIADKILAARPDPSTEIESLGELAAEPLPGAIPAPPVREAMDVEVEVLEELVGTYRVNPLGSCEVFLHDGRLFVRTPLGQEAELFCEAKDRFFLKTTNLTMTMHRGEAGAIEAVDLVMGGRRLRGSRVE